MTRLKTACCILPALLAAASASQAQDSWSDQLSGAVSGGKASLDFRYRFEHVDQKNFSKDAKASTLRSRLTLASGQVSGFSGLVEFDNVTTLGADDYNSTENGKTDYPVIADPEGTEVNQAWLKWSHEEFYGIYGRQRVNHGNQRFVGGVGWRQNEQTYDGFRAVWDDADDTVKLDFSYVYNVNRIFGPDDGANPANLRGDSIFFRGDYEFADDHDIAFYGYEMEFDERGSYAAGKTVNLSNLTYGIEYRGKFDWLTVAAAFATQGDAGDSELDYDAVYYLGELGADWSGFNFKVGYEVLGADDGVGFQTPLATLHKFQGWADKFLSTPGDGVEDLYLSAGTKAGPVKLGVIYHDFQAEDSSEDFGTEWDLVATWPVDKRFSVQAKYAAFSSDSDRYDDTDKFWVTLQLKL